MAADRLGLGADQIKLLRKRFCPLHDPTCGERGVLAGSAPASPRVVSWKALVMG